jgi:hypothetical protein
MGYLMPLSLASLMSCTVSSSRSGASGMIWLGFLVDVDAF